MHGRIADPALRFGQELRRWRTERRLTQRELAQRVRYSRETVAAVERSRRYPSREFARRCDEVLTTGGVLDWLWPHVETAQVAADRRRGPRSVRPAPAAGEAVELVGWVESFGPEFIVRLRDLVKDLVPVGARSG